jgi:hypothetical protein
MDIDVLAELDRRRCYDGPNAGSRELREELEMASLVRRIRLRSPKDEHSTHDLLQRGEPLWTRDLLS